MSARSSTTASRSKFRSVAYVTAARAVICGTCCSPRRARSRRLHDAGGLMAVGLRERVVAALHLLMRARRPSLRGSGAPRSARRRRRSLRLSRGGPESVGGGDWTPRGTPASSRESPAARWAPLDLVAQGGQARGEFRAVDGRRVLLRPVQLLRLERARLAVAPLRHVEEHDVGVQLRRGVPVDRAARCHARSGRRPTVPVVSAG